MQQPKVGLILLRAEWFDSVVALPELVEKIEVDHQAIVADLDALFTIAGQWIINADESLARAERDVRQADVDLFILIFQVWAEDFYLVPLVQAIGDLPLAVWCYVPWEQPPRPASFIDVLRGSGPVGTMEGLGVIRNMGVDFVFTMGPPGHPRVHADLMRAAQAGRIRRLLRKARFGILPYRNEQMQTTFVDEFRLRTELGPEVELVSVGELSRTAETITEQEATAFMNDLKTRFTVRGVTDETLLTAARASLALAHVAVNHNLNLISLNDIAPELHIQMGLRPCLYPPLFDEENILVGLEGDLGAATAMYILNQLTASPVLFAETWFWDEDENVIVTGHAGPQNPALAREGSCWVSHDFEFAQSDRTEGAHLQFVTRPGKVTLLQLRCTPNGWQAICTTGDAVDTECWVEGYPHAVIHLDTTIADFLYQVAAVGSTQHWAVVYGLVAREVEAVCKLLKIPLLIIGCVSNSG